MYRNSVSRSYKWSRNGRNQGEHFHLGRLQHPRIVQYLGVQKTADRILIFMEYMTGGSLKEHIALVGSLSDAVARRHTSQVCAPLYIRWYYVATGELTVPRY